jgi:hypothetical protein
MLYLEFYVPLYDAVGLKSHAKNRFNVFYSITKKKPKSKLHRYISVRDLKIIKNKLKCIRGIEELR